MKTLIAASALALASNFALADAFDYEKAIGSPDLDPSLSNNQGNFAMQIASDVRVSLHDWYRGNPDVYDGSDVTPSAEVVMGDSLPTSLELFGQGNPDIDPTA